jgi:transposase InsO family protein
MAIARRRPGPGLVHHSDHGSQYVSLAMGEHLREAGIETSMGAKRSALDNAVVESFFSTLKRELVNRCSCPTKAEARVAVFEWIEAF